MQDVLEQKSKSLESNSLKLLPENYKFLQQEILRGTGIVLGEDKHYLFESRLALILRDANLRTLNDLCARLRTKLHPGLSQQVLEALTTNETFFFRDVTPFEILRTTIVPELLARLPPQKPLRIWSAAASSGQEPYSIAMLLHELQVQHRCAEILATDISDQILDYARKATYAQFEANRGLPAMYLAKYFQREGLDWHLKDEIRKAVRFRQLDLRRPIADLGKFHIVFCRNVMIYFDLETKKKVLHQIGEAIEPGGYLILGSAESIQGSTDGWERISINNTYVYRKR